MIKFARNTKQLGDKEILKALLFDENGNKIKMLGLIGKVKDLVEIDLIEIYNVDLDEDGEKWLALSMINNKTELAETKQEAAQIIRKWFDK